MKRLIAAVTAVILLLMCSSCTPKGSGKSIAYPLSASPSTLDPQYANDTNAMVIINNTFEGLVRLDANGDVIPGIAKSWSISPDGKTYTFKLKEGTEWFCPTALKYVFGEEFYKRFSSETVTAHDFVFAFQRAVMPETGSPNAHRLFVIENAYEISYNNYSEKLLGATAPDDHTLIIKLTEKTDDPTPDCHYIYEAEKPELFSLIDKVKHCDSETQKRLTAYFQMISEQKES